MKEKYAFKRIIAVLLCCVLVFSLISCKKKDNEADKSTKNKQEVLATSTPTPTPALPSVDELVAAAQAQSGSIMSPLNDGSLDTILESFDMTNLKIPEGKTDIDINLDLSVNLLSLVNIDAKGNVKGQASTSGNIIAGNTDIDMAMTAESMKTSTSSIGGDTPSTQQIKESVRFYIDCSNGEDIITYAQTGSSEWKKSTAALDELRDKIQQNASMIENGNSDSNMFKDTDKFMKDHSTVSAVGDGYALTTEFTWQDFYRHYEKDFAELSKQINEAVDMLMSFFSDSEEEEIPDYISDFFKSGTGSFKTVVSYSKDKIVTGIKLYVNDFHLSTQLNIGDASAPIYLAINNMNVTVDVDKIDGPVKIPEDVIANAVEDVKSTWDQDDWDWDTADPDTSWDD